MLQTCAEHPVLAREWRLYIEECIYTWGELTLIFYLCVSRWLIPSILSILFFKKAVQRRLITLSAMAPKELDGAVVPRHNPTYYEQTDELVLPQKTWWKDPGLRRLYIMAPILFLGSTINGYNGSLLNGCRRWIHGKHVSDGGPSVDVMCIGTDLFRSHRRL